jgi:dipeptidase
VRDGKILSPGNWPQPDTGRSSRLIPKIKTNKGPIRNVGTHMPIIAIAIGIKSKNVFLFNAASTPKNTPITKAIKIA